MNIEEISRHVPKNWIRERIVITGNREEVEIASNEPNRIFVKEGMRER